MKSITQHRMNVAALWEDDQIQVTEARKMMRLKSKTHTYQTIAFALREKRRKEKLAIDDNLDLLK